MVYSPAEEWLAQITGLRMKFPAGYFQGIYGSFSPLAGPSTRNCYKNCGLWTVDCGLEYQIIILQQLAEGIGIGMVGLPDGQVAFGYSGRGLVANGLDGADMLAAGFGINE